MKRYLFLMLVFVFLSCGDTVEKDKLHILNGYWEITEVEFSNGKKKEYKVNSNIDYFKLNDLKGYRKKVNPKFDGTYETSDDAEPFTILEENSIFKIAYKNSLSEWQETITSLSNNHFSVKNDEGTVYRYKRFEPINITP